MNATHEVLNQVPPLNRVNAFSDDIALQQGLEQSNGKWAASAVEEYGCKIHLLEQLGIEANRYLPELHTHDRYGYRCNTVSYHQSYHQLMTQAKQAGVHSLPWQREQLGAHAARLCLEYIHIQAEAGTACPISMTFAGTPLLQQNNYLKQHWWPKAIESSYDSSHQPIEQKTSLTLGMAMTEKQGGSDVRTNLTQATSIGDDCYALTGHKWFCSAPMSDGFFVTAKAKEGLTCFLVPRWRPDDTQNSMHVMRLKDKLGNLSNASSEVEFDSAMGWRVGEEGQGIKTILHMVALTRFDCMVGSTALMRQAWVQAYHHACYRQAFGKPLIEQPLMRNVLAEGAIEIEGHLAFCFELARLLDDGSEQALQKVRFLTALGKYWICKRAPTVIVEMMECLGGAGYVEDFMLARLYREAPLNAIWEGCGNIQCLDNMRMMHKAPELVKSMMSEVVSTLSDLGLSNQVVHLKQSMMAQPDTHDARRLCELWVKCYQAHLLAKTVPERITESFVHKLNLSNAMLGCLDKSFIEPILLRAWSQGMDS